MILISNLVLRIEDGSTVAATEIYGTDKKTYINIGSGNVFNLAWDHVTLTNDLLDSYKLVIKRYDPTINVYYDIFDKNIGLVSNFSVNSNILPTAPNQYLLSIYLVAFGKAGSTVTSDIVHAYISNGCCTLVKAEEGYMKRAISFVKADLTMLAEGDELILTEADGKALLVAEDSEQPLIDYTGERLTDSTGELLIVDATPLLRNVNGWAVVQEGYIKGNDGKWHSDNAKYEALLASDGTIIEVLNDEQLYEPLCIL